MQKNKLWQNYTINHPSSASQYRFLSEEMTTANPAKKPARLSSVWGPSCQEQAKFEVSNLDKKIKIVTNPFPETSIKASYLPVMVYSGMHSA